MPSGNNDSLNQLQQQQQAALTQGGQNIQAAFSKFNPAFYQGVEDNYINQALPQEEQQYRQQGQNLNYQLNDRGLTRSSAAQNLNSSLQQQRAQNQEQLINQGQQAAQSLQQNVANEESQLYGQLQVSQNPTAIAQQSANLAAQTAAPSVFAPIGNMFSNWSNMYLANQASNNTVQQNELASSLYLPYLNQQNNSGLIPQNG